MKEYFKHIIVTYVNCTHRTLKLTHISHPALAFLMYLKVSKTDYCMMYLITGQQTDYWMKRTFLLLHVVFLQT